ncbi:MAG: protein translocase subunit SecF [Xanthomonadales bacterium]|nr:protein translocase subunit SecF [Xanthomonadales bacterium]
MFELFNPAWKLPFMRWSRVTLWLSLLAVAVSIVALVRPGLNFALDFTGGTVVELSFEESADLARIRSTLADAGYEGAQVQSFGSTRDVLIRLRPDADVGAAAEGDEARQEAQDAGLAQSAGEAVHRLLTQAGMPSELKRNEFVGPQIGRELAEQGIIAILVVIGGILIYIAVRFEWRFGLAAIAGELHDVIITLGFLALVGREFDLPALAAVLAVAGYSINDKIVIFDRIREMFRTSRRMGPEETIDVACNTTLARTIITSFVTLLSVLALFFIGGEALKSFSLVLIVGIVVGTYSSILFAAPLLNRLGVTKQDLMPKMRDETELQRRP